MADEQSDFIDQSVLLHFPGRFDAIRDLARRSQDFRDMCQELGEAEAALSRMGAVQPDLRAERLEECLGWIDRLTREMEGALSEANIIRLSRQNQERLL